MSRKNLQSRDNWQTDSGPGGKAGVAEQNLIRVFREAFQGTDYFISDHPTDLKHLYENVVLSPETTRQIFNPDAMTMKKPKVAVGVFPLIFQLQIEKQEKYFLVKSNVKMAGLKEKDPSAGRGNAHERMCKLFTPGLMKAYRRIGKITDPSILPFWVVLEGDITRDPKRNREISFWFDEYDKNFFMWRPGVDGLALVEHFNKYLKKYLGLTLI